MQGVGWSAGPKRQGSVLMELTCSVPSADPLLPSWEEGEDPILKGLHQAQTRHPNQRCTAPGYDSTRCPLYRETFFYGELEP